jgi:hypothetical protein
MIQTGEVGSAYPPCYSPVFLYLNFAFPDPGNALHRHLRGIEIWQKPAN